MKLIAVTKFRANLAILPKLRRREDDRAAGRSQIESSTGMPSILVRIYTLKCSYRVLRMFAGFRASAHSGAFMSSARS